MNTTTMKIGLKAATVQIATFQRSGRFFHATFAHQNLGGWYFSTREGVDYGPYLSVTEAQQRCATHVQRCIASNIHGRRGIKASAVPAQYKNQPDGRAVL